MTSDRRKASFDQEKDTAAVRPAGWRPWWSFPWGYRESLAFVSGLILVGFLLQIVRPLDLNSLARPANFIVLAVLLIPPLWAAVSPGNKFLLWLGSIPLSVALIAAFLIISLFMGLTPQSSSPIKSPDFVHRLGLGSLTSSWTYILIHLGVMVSLSLALVNRLRRKGPKAAFILNHLGLWLLLAAAGLGAADRRSYILWVEEGQVEWRGRTAQGLVVELPLAVKLHDFQLEQYPPKLAVIDKSNGRPLPDERPDWHQIEPGRSVPGRLAGWVVNVDQYIHSAIRGKGGEYIESPRPDAVPAALVSAIRGGDKFQGWVTDGGVMQPFQALALGENEVLVMARPEPKRFSSDISVYVKDLGDKRQVAEVNKPLSLGPWMVYQHSYDDRLGRMARNSGFEAVYDPWWFLARSALWIMAAGAFLLIWGGRKRGMPGGERFVTNPADADGESAKLRRSKAPAGDRREGAQ